MQAFTFTDICEATAMNWKIPVSIVSLPPHSRYIHVYTLWFEHLPNSNNNGIKSDESEIEKESVGEWELLLIENRNHDSRFVTTDSKCSIDMYNVHIDEIQWWPSIRNKLIWNTYTYIYRMICIAFTVDQPIRHYSNWNWKEWWYSIFSWNIGFMSTYKALQTQSKCSNYFKKTTQYYMKFIKLWNVEDVNRWH